MWTVSSPLLCVQEVDRVSLACSEIGLCLAHKDVSEIVSCTLRSNDCVSGMSEMRK